MAFTPVYHLLACLTFAFLFLLSTEVLMLAHASQSFNKLIIFRRYCLFLYCDYMNILDDKLTSLP